MEKWFSPIQASGLPAAESILVFAPHPDDEIFGCGGAITLYAQQQSCVHIHILTDGAGYATQEDRIAIREKRRNESINAITQLGIGINYDFGPYQDRSLMQESSLIQHIKQLLQQHQPQLVIAPSPWEIHPDHQACARAVTAAISAIQRTNLSEIALMFYEIGNPLRTNFLLDISNVWHIKAKSMQSFSSQLQNQDYLKHVQGLNAYRTYSLPMNVQYAEAYYYLDASVLLSMTSPKNNSDESTAGLAQFFQDHWTESVLQSASVYAEELQREVIKQEKHNAELIQVQLKILQLQDLLSARLASVQQELIDIKQTTSWRITKPLRIMRSYINSIRGK